MSFDDQMAELFVEEAAELLSDFEGALLLLESLPDDVELLNRVFRCAHTLKGNSKILGFEVVASFTHELENLLDKLRKQELLVTQGVTNTLLASLDVLRALVTEIGGGQPHSSDSYLSTLVRIRALVAELDARLDPRPPEQAFELPSLDLATLDAALPAPPTDAAVPFTRVSVVPEPASAAAPVAVPATPPEPPSTTSDSPSAVLTPATNPAEASRPAQRSGVQATGPTPAKEPAATAPGKERRASDGESSTVRVPIEKLDRLINLTGEVVIAQSMIAQLISDLTPERVALLQEVVAQMDRHCRELQERMLGARMLPIKNVFARFQRLVRDLAGATGKALALEVSGEETELDKTVIEKISDPLTHLVRNAIDHGVELPDERRALGKPEQARIKLSAYQKGGSIFIEVSDDGRGLNTQRILDKAQKLGLVDAQAVLSDDEVHALIFRPGFSTADQVTEISGRGVGMDVVKRNVEALKGSITILSTPGVGTCFRVKLPLTLAILDGLGLRIGSQVYLVPLVSIVESVQPRPEDVRRIANVGEVVEVRGEQLPLLRLYELFGVTPQHVAAHHGLVMVLDDGLQKLAVQVDELIGQYQVVIKSLEANFQRVPGIAGATILGDGQVALILDAANLASLARTRACAPRSMDPVEVEASAGGQV